MSAADRTFQCNVAVFESESTVQRVVLPDGHRFVMLMRGHQPDIVEIDDPGEYEIDALDLGGAEYPIALCVIDLAHVPAWSSLTIDDVDRMIDRVERTTKEIKSRRSHAASRARAGA